MVSHWNLKDNNSSQVLRTLLSILADLNNTLVWIVSTRPLLSMSSCRHFNPLVTVHRAPFTIGITVYFHVQQFFSVP